MRVRMTVSTLAFLSAAALVAALGAGCASDTSSDSTPRDTKPVAGTTEPAGGGEAPQGGADADPGAPVSPADLAWLDTTLTDVKTGKTFKVSDFKGRPVFVKTFAVW